MSRYIPYDKIKKLREAAKNGDERAKRILMAQLDDEQDFSADLDDYFKPAEENKPDEMAQMPQEDAKQEDTQIIKQQPQNVIAGQVPENEISDNILALISSCDKKTIEIANNPDLSDATKKGSLSILQEIKQSCLENLEKFGKLMSSITKKTVEEDF